MFVIGIDLGSRNFAASVLEIDSKEKVFKLIETNYWYLEPNKIGDRLIVLEQKLSDLITRYPIKQITYEDSVFKGRCAADLNYCAAIIHYCAAKYKLKLQKVSPTEAKKLVCGNGKADKKEMEASVKSLLSNPPEKFENDHLADSCGIAFCKFL